MNAHPNHDPVQTALQRLSHRVRWKRLLGKAHLFVWMFALMYLGLFLADMTVGFRTLTLRMCLTALALVASTHVVWSGLTWWFARFDLLGLAQIFEKQFPSLSERLLTLVQIDAVSTPPTNPEFAALLRRETAQQLADLDAKAACPLHRERRAWLITTPVLGIALLGLCLAPTFREFSGRLFASWMTPLTPYRIELRQSHGYALRGSAYRIEGMIVRQDRYAPEVTECRFEREDEPGSSLASASIHDGSFAIDLETLGQPLRGRIVVGETRSHLIEVEWIDPPVLTSTPKVVVSPPAYLAQTGVKTFDWSSGGSELEILQYSRLALAFEFDQACHGVLVLESTTEGNGKAKTRVLLQPGTKPSTCIAEVLASQVGAVRAELQLNLVHDLTASIPLGTWNVHADRMPRFTQSLRFVGGSGSLRSTQAYRISPDDVVRLETAAADEEGLHVIEVEYRVNEDPPRVVPWINASGKRQVTIHERMPLPKGLKQGDRVQFRLRASDNRKLQRGESDAKAPFPAADLGAQIAIAPDSGPDAWIRLDVDTSIDSFVKQQAETQSEEVRGVIDAIKMKLVDEAQQVDKLKRGIHLQAALTLDQRMQTERLQTLNREISEDLLRAGQRFLLDPELARLAEHFLDIAETEMQKAGGSLARFAEKDRPLIEGERELRTAHEALLQALKKLDRMHDWNKMIAQDRLDQAQLDKLAQRQQNLAERLEALRNKEGLSEADLAKQIEAIRQEQADVAQQTELLKDENRLVQESLAALERQRVEKLAQDAEKLAAEQQAMRDMSADKMTTEMKERLQELTRRQADLGKRLQAKPALEAADALSKPLLDRAIDRQKEQEKQLQDALAKLLPGVVTNALREQIMRLAKDQQKIRSDLERVGQQVGQLNETMLKERLKDLVARQRGLQSAIAKLPIDAKNAAVRESQKIAEQSAREAADQLTAKDALRSFSAMEKTQQELEGLAARLPQTLAKDRNDIKDPMTLAKIEQVEKFAEEQAKLRKETEQLLADGMKAVASKEGDAVREKTEQLAKDLLELAQKATSPEAKAMAKESASALEQAKKAMDAGAEAKGKGEPSKMEDAEAAKQLELAFKQLQKFAQDQAMKAMNKEDPEKTAEALKAGVEQMKIADSKLPKATKDAQAAMQAAAQKLTQAANQASKQASRKLPKAARNPTVKAGPMPGAGDVAAPRDLKFESFEGKSWGELPGELKTRMIQDFRTRYGDEYAEVIQQYFERLAQTPAHPPAERKK